MIKILTNSIISRYQRRVREREFSKHNVFVNRNSVLGSNTSIGTGTNINGAAYITSNKDAPVRIGKYCAIGHNLRIHSTNHYIGCANLQYRFQKHYNLPSLNVYKGPVVIGNNVWIGDNVMVLSGVEIGDGAVIGAGSIVTKNVAAFSVFAGNPAKLIKMRFSENIISQLMEIKWWDWSEEKIIRNRGFFELDLLKHPSANFSELIEP